MRFLFTLWLNSLLWRNSITRGEHISALCIPKEVKHIEWYAIDVDTALKGIRRWKGWIVTQKPFDESGNLTAYWYWKVERLKGCGSGWTQLTGIHGHIRQEQAN